MERYLGDLDTFCAYRTSRTLMIRDKRLGLSLFSLQAVIFLYVVIWQLILSQVYMKESDFATVVRLQLQAPTLPYRWPPAIAPPYCLGATALPPPSVYPLASAYAIPSPGEFTYNGLSQEQRHCQYMDETGAVPIPETDRMFITSETRQTNQSVVGGDPATCSTLSSLDCTFLPAYNRDEDAVTRRSFVADVEFFTLLIDHSLAAPSAGISRTVSSMEGSLLDQSGKVMNPCDDYAGMPKGCPTNATAGFDVALGKAGLPDIVSLKTLLRAAGITSMDQLAGLQGRDAGESLREAGLVLNLEIYYTNYFFSGKGAFQLGNGAIDNSRVVYQYRVTTVANTEYKFITGVYPFGDQTTRELMNRHGIRLLVTTTGRIGFFDLMTLLVRVVAAPLLLPCTATRTQTRLPPRITTHPSCFHHTTPHHPPPLLSDQPERGGWPHWAIVHFHGCGCHPVL